MLDVVQVEIRVYFVRILVFDKVAKCHWNLITIYGDAQINGKAAFLAELSKVYHDNPQPCLVGGDFNLIRNSSEKNKPNETDHWSFVFNVIIEHAGLRELPLNGRNFTWANNLVDPTIEKLDRVLICPDWEEHYPLSFRQALKREVSDHTPLLLDTGSHNISQPIFKFQNSWMLRDGFKEFVTSIWTNHYDGSNIEK